MKTALRLSSHLVVLTILSTSLNIARQSGVKSDSVENLARDFVALLSKEDYAGAAKNFDATVSAALPPEKLQQIWKSLAQQVGAFKGQLGTKTQTLQGYDIVLVTCQFEKSPLDVKVVYNGARHIAGLFFVPTQSAGPAESRSANENDVMVGKGEWALHGTLSIPEGAGPFPAVVLVHGSGPNDRDETIGPNKPFRDVARGLTAKGIGVLRYEKRTREHADLFVPIKDSITVKEETIDDALMAVALLRENVRIDRKKIFVLGHSLGGMLVPRIAMLDPTIAGFIILAGTSRPLEDVILDQMTYLLSRGGATADEQKARLESVRKQVAGVKDPALSVTTPANELPLGIPAKYWLDLREYHPAEVAKNIEARILILQGERDYQVTMEDFAGWKKSLSSRPNVDFRTYPKLNHLFIEGSGKSTPHEYDTEGHVAQYVIDDIAGWIRKN